MRNWVVNYLLDLGLAAYSHFPHCPGKGWIYDRTLSRVGAIGGSPRIRSRFGVKFECDLEDKLTRELYFIGFARRDCRVLRRLVKPGDVVLDIGANIGYFTLLFANWLQGNGEVHAFEPFPTTMQRLNRNLDLNPRLRNVVHLHGTAVSDFVGSMAMTEPDKGNSGCNYLSVSGEGKIGVTTLDSLASEMRFSRIDLMKIDVEGCEVALLKGAKSTLDRYRPVLMIEINPGTLKRFGQTAKDVVALLGNYRYRMAYANRLGMLKPLQTLPVDGQEPNIFCFPMD
jgi:FkbM family methyltransferase